MSGELSNWDILDFCKKIKIKLDGGVVMKDQLTTKKKNYTIINLESSTAGNGGTHWTCLLHQKEGWFFFDSYGVQPSEEIIKYVGQFSEEPFAYNSFQIQHYNSTFCGWFCLGLIAFVKHSPLSFYDSINEFINTFQETKLMNNDKIIQTYIKSILK